VEVRDLTSWICDILEDIHDDVMVQRVRGQVIELCKRFPVYK
jgi:glycine hydroxymethyltransferase